MSMKPVRKCTTMSQRKKMSDIAEAASAMGLLPISFTKANCKGSSITVSTVNNSAAISQPRLHGANGEIIHRESVSGPTKVVVPSAVFFTVRPSIGVPGRVGGVTRPVVNENEFAVAGCPSFVVNEPDVVGEELRLQLAAGAAAGAPQAFGMAKLRAFDMRFLHPVLVLSSAPVFTSQMPSFKPLPPKASRFSKAASSSSASSLPSALVSEAVSYTHLTLPTKA